MKILEELKAEFRVKLVELQRLLDAEILEKKSIESELQRKVEDLAQANQRKDDFLAILGHELRNPLSAMSNSIAVLRMANATEENKATSLDMLKNQTEHIAVIVDNVITVSRAVRGMITLNKEWVKLSEIVERAVQIVEPMIECRRHKLRIDAPCNGHLIIFGDKIRLVQAISNLLQNSAKYTPNGGEISLECKEQDDKEITILVKDNGIGIVTSLIPHLFDLCVRGQQAMQKENGMGIGLTMVKTIIELHGGTVMARSQGSDQGSEFLIRLPFGRAESETASDRGQRTGGQDRRNAPSVDGL
jgi:signal transduction histidine kinase